MTRLYEYKTTPYEHQAKALKRALSLKQCALLMEPRTGKTKVAIDYASALYAANRIQCAVIVAPARVLDVWVQEFHTHCPVPYTVHVWDAKARKHPIPQVNTAQGLHVLLVNYEAFARSGKVLPSGNRSTKTGREAHRRQIERWVTSSGKHCAFILDESHKIKSPSSKAGSMLVSMRTLTPYRLILTGTPITKASRVFDIYMQWKFLNPQRFSEWPTAASFKDRYMQTRSAQTDSGYTYETCIKVLNEAELTERIYEDAFRVKRADCFDLPERAERIVPVELVDSGETYDTLAREMVAEIEAEGQRHTLEASIALVLNLRLTQITGGFTKTDAGVIVPVGTEKLDVLEGLLEETLDNDEKIVVAARFKPEMNAIHAMAVRMGLPVFEVRGGLSRDQSTNNISAFRECDGSGVLVMQPQAGGVGIDLSTAAHMVWYSLPQSWVDYTQACDRIALSKKATTYTYLLAKGTLDELMYEVLQEDADMSEKILKDPRRLLR